MSNLKMQQIDGGAATLGNLDRFGDGLKNLFTLAASVRRIDTPIFGGDLCHLHQLVSRDPEAGSLMQRRGDPERAIFHGLLDKTSHPLYFGGSGRARLCSMSGLVDQT